jgi:tripartite-type tricarboxylate transporter receptor subunit TctC
MSAGRPHLEGNRGLARPPADRRGSTARAVAGAALAAALSAGAAMAIAQASWPAKPVRVIIPWAPAGSNDGVGRIVFQRLAEQYGQAFVVENRGGAAGTLGAAIVARAPADGYTVMVHSASHLGNAHLYKNLPYDTLKDFTAVANLASQPGVLVVHPAFPAKTLKEFLAIAKARPRQIEYATPGNGSAPHLFMTMLTSMTGVELQHVPYKGGPQATTSVLQGETQTAFSTLPNALAQVQAGKLRPIAVSTPQRLSVLPDVPTVAEAGVPSYEWNPWIGVMAPAGVPSEIVERMHGDMQRILGREDTRRGFQGLGVEPIAESLEAFRTRIARDFERYRKLYALIEIKIQ